MLEFVLDFLFPPACSVCGKLDKNWLCPKCKSRVERLEKSNLVEIEDKEYEKLLYLFEYQSLVRKLILRYKFSNKAYLNHFFANVMIHNGKSSQILKEYDLIIPVPMHKKKMQKRGYNQTELVANELGKSLEDRKSVV